MYWPPGDLIAVDIGNRGLQTVIKVCIAQTHISPIIREFLNTGHIEAGISGIALKCSHNGVHGGLGGQAGHGRHGGIHNVNASLCCHQQRSDLIAGGVMGMEVDRNTNLLAFKARTSSLAA